MWVSVAVPVAVLLLVITGVLAFLYRAHTQERRALETAPQGLVTVMFTDIQASSKLWEKAPVSMAEALALHNACVRQVVERFGGFEVKTIGDAFMVAAPSFAWNSPTSELRASSGLRAQL